MLALIRRAILALTALAVIPILSSTAEAVVMTSPGPYDPQAIGGQYVYTVAGAGYSFVW